MTRYLALLAAAMLVACTGKGDDKDTTDDTGGTVGDDDDDDACANSVVNQFPAQGDTDVYYKTAVRFTLDEADPAASITITDGAGAAVSGTTTVTDTLVSWSGDDLTPSTEYTATLSYVCGDAAVTWTTSNVGTPVGGAVDLTTMVYGLDVASGQWVEPAGVGDLLASQLGDTQIFVAPTEVTADAIAMFGAIGSGNTQDICSPTIPFPAADFADPYFSLQAPVLPLDISGFIIEIEDLDMSGAFAPDGSRIQGALLGGSVNTVALGEAFDLGTAPDAVCQLVGTFGVSCEECGDGSGPYCLSVYVDSIAAPRIDGLALVTRTQEEIDADPACQ